MSEIVLRPYQHDAINAVMRYIGDGGGNPIVDKPTGTGKGLTIVALACLMVDEWDVRVTIVTDRARLLSQNMNDLRAYAPHVDAGLYSASLYRRDIGRRVMFVQIQSGWDKPELHDADIVIVDEGHIGGMRYDHFIGAVRARNPDARIVCFSATPFFGPRATPLTEKKNAIYDSFAYRMSIREALEGKWLCPLTVQDAEVQIDVGGLSAGSGDFTIGEMQSRADTPAINAAVVEETRYALARRRRAGMCFVAGVEHAAHLRDMMLAKRVSCEIIDGSTPATRCDAIYEGSKTGAVRMIVTVNKALTGVNLPWLDFGIMARATNLPHVQIQAAGRLMRTFEGKEDALWWCHGKNVERLGPIDDIKRRPRRDPSYKMCPKCVAKNMNFAIVCGECGFEFPPSEATDDKPDAVSAVASKMSILTRRDDKGRKLSRWRVHSWAASVGIKEGSQYGFTRVDWWGTLEGKDSEPSKFASEFAFFDHPLNDGLRKKAAQRWRELGICDVSPTGIGDAMVKMNAKPCTVEWADTIVGPKKHRQIVGLEFYKKAQQASF